MPIAAMTPCRHQGCRALVAKGYCDEHKQQSTRKQFDRDRGSANSRGYNYKWQKARKIFLAEHPLCVECESNEKVTAANVVDHIIAHKGDQVLFWDESNWQPLCATCHNIKTATQDSSFAGRGG